MKRLTTTSLALAALSLALILPASAQNGNQTGNQNGDQTGSQAASQNGDMQGSQNMNMPHTGRHEAMQMAPARVVLDRSLDADKTKPGFQFRAKLLKKVQLKNGPELPAGTLLLGQISADDMNEGGTSKLALRFTQADLKDGQIVPIKATIVGIYDPSNYSDPNDYPDSPDNLMPNSWNDGTLQVDQIGVMSGVDLHSKIASRNSGVFVSTRKDNVNLPAGRVLQLAVAEQSHGHNQMNGMNGSNGMNGKNCAQ